MEQKTITAILVGAGRRAMTYAEEALRAPQNLKIVGVADVDAYRREKVMQMYGVAPEHCFDSAEALAKVPKFADVIINGTMDADHVRTSVPLLKLGYDMLLEKPFAVNEAEMNELLSVVREHKNRVMICHVLRYSPFYRSIKEHILSGEIGEITTIRTAENVSYHHVSSSYVRGKWANYDECKTTMLLAKCCHDVDIMMWLMGDTKPDLISSFGSVYQFKPSKAPENAGTKCLVDCPLVDSCVYSTKRIYLEHPARWANYVWADFDKPDATYEEKVSFLTGDSSFAKCIYKCDNNIVDHQSVLVEFENGAIGTHSLSSGTPTSGRTIDIEGTMGSIRGVFEDEKFTIRTICPEADKGYLERTIDVSSEAMGDAHGGGDERLVRDFIAFVRGEEPSVSCTDIFDSVAGHRSVFLADRSRENGGVPQKY